VAVYGARATDGHEAADSDFSSSDPDHASYRNRWGSAWRAFFGELRRLGYIEGENLIIERYSAEGHHERYADLARQIVTRNPDVIVTGTNPVVIVFKAATSTIPTVAFMIDPLQAGLVTSLGDPAATSPGSPSMPGWRIGRSAYRYSKRPCLRPQRSHFWGCARGGKVLLGNWCGTLALNWEFRCFLPSRSKGTPRKLRALSLRLSSNGLMQFLSVGKETFTRTAG
jgi:hypothetical protein